MNDSKDLYDKPLVEPIKVSEQNWSSTTLPFVATATLSYNHEPYIRECIEGILMQKTTFPVRICIFEDASTDNTANIIQEYEKKYPGLIVSFCQKENTFHNHEKREKAMNPFYKSLFEAKFIAICEGDDYWTDPLKLQKQVDYLVKNEDCSFCFHASKTIRNKNDNDFTIRKPSEIPFQGKFDINHLIIEGGGFIPTDSILLHSKHINGVSPEWMRNLQIGDLPLMLLLATKGKIGYIDEVMSVYRFESSPCAWSTQMVDIKKRNNHHFRISKMWTEFDKWTEYKYHKTISKKKNLNKKIYIKDNLRYFFKHFFRI